MASLQPVLKKDYMPEFNALVHEANKVHRESGMEEAMNLLLGLEKKCRLGGDLTTLKEVCVHMIRFCKDKGDWEKLSAVLSVVSKRRAQAKTAIEAIVKEAYGYLDDCPGVKEKTNLATVLKEVCDGKIYVEAESARLHLMLALILEEQGDLAGACAMIQDVHVETYGSIPKLEKAEYILQQMRINLKKKDFIRALIQSRKMNRNTLEEEGFEAVKISFYNMMIEYYMPQKEAWEICQCYYRIYDTSLTKEDMAACNHSLEACTVFLVLSKFDNHVSDMMHRLKAIKAVQENVLCKETLDLFTTPEIVPYPFNGLTSLQSHTCLSKEYVSKDIIVEYAGFFKLRTIQHNLRTVAKYYTQMYTKALAEMLGLTDDELEQNLSEMCAAGDIFVKIDRPKGIVDFTSRKKPDEVLSEWGSDMNKLLSLMEQTCHLINRENMVHRV